MRLRFVLPFLLVGSLIGCNASQKPEKTQKAIATEQWNDARSGVLCGLATEQYKSGNFDKARETVTTALALSPRSAILRILSAKIAIEQSQLDLAESELRQAQIFDPHNAQADYLCGIIYQRWQKPQAALELYQQAANKAPEEVAYVLACEEMLLEMDRTTEALDMLNDKLDYFQHSAVLYDAAGQILLGLHRYPEAVKMLHQAEILATDDPSVKEHFALALYFNKEYRESAELLQKLTSETPGDKRVDLLLALAECQEQTGRLDDAKATFENATQVSPGTAEAWTGLAKISLEKNDVRRAELSLKRAMSLDASSSEPQLLLGYVRLRQNRMDDALPLFQKAAALSANDPVSQCMIGYVYEKTGKPELAIQCYAKALKLHPGDELATKLMTASDAGQ